MTKIVDFGFQSVPEHLKAGKVAQVFDSVARRYDVMNDLMSAGMHRLWKRFAVTVAKVRPGERLLDVATGSGDLARLLALAQGVQDHVRLVGWHDRILGALEDDQRA